MHNELERSLYNSALIHVDSRAIIVPVAKHESYFVWPIDWLEKCNNQFIFRFRVYLCQINCLLLLMMICLFVFFPQNLGLKPFINLSQVRIRGRPALCKVPCSHRAVVWHWKPLAPCIGRVNSVTSYSKRVVAHPGLMTVQCLLKILTSSRYE